MARERQYPRAVEVEPLRRATWLAGLLVLDSLATVLFPTAIEYFENGVAKGLLRRWEQAGQAD
jgi:hypothetical protein